jgi:hypothetical protein
MSSTATAGWPNTTPGMASARWAGEAILSTGRPAAQARELVEARIQPSFTPVGQSAIAAQHTGLIARRPVNPHSPPTAPLTTGDVIMRTRITTMITATLAAATLAGCTSTPARAPSAADPPTATSGPVAIAGPFPTRAATPTAGVFPRAPRGALPAVLPSVALPQNCRERGSPRKLQAAVDAGHQPWHVDPGLVVLACLRVALGEGAWSVHATAPGVVVASEPRTDLHARFQLAQTSRRGRGGIWQITGVRADRELILPPSCADPDPDGMLAAFADGHQPWRGSPLDEARVCVSAAFGWTDVRVHTTGDGSYLATAVSAGNRQSARIEIVWHSGHGVRLPFVSSVAASNSDG